VTLESGRGGLHTGSDIFPRSVNSLEAAEQAKNAGIRAVVFKSHYTDTEARAELASIHAGFPVFGGITLNYPVGGLKPPEQGLTAVLVPAYAAVSVDHLDPLLEAPTISLAVNT
jgi:Family of unknown function (DUF6282)